MTDATFTLQCGMVVRWEQNDAFKNDELEILKMCACNGCGSRRWVSGDKPGGLKVLLRTEIIGSLAEMEKDMREMISSDCWAVLTTSACRDIVHKQYFNTRDNDGEPISESENQLIDDASPLIDCVELGQTVIIIMGKKHFLDIYYSKTGGVLLKNTVDHTLNW